MLQTVTSSYRLKTLEGILSNTFNVTSKMRWPWKVKDVKGVNEYVCLHASTCLSQNVCERERVILMVSH
jgi:hypothetical protein